MSHLICSFAFRGSSVCPGDIFGPYMFFSLKLVWAFVGRGVCFFSLLFVVSRLSCRRQCTPRDLADACPGYAFPHLGGVTHVLGLCGFCTRFSGVVWLSSEGAGYRQGIVIGGPVDVVLNVCFDDDDDDLRDNEFFPSPRPPTPPPPPPPRFFNGIVSPLSSFLCLLSITWHWTQNCGQVVKAPLSGSILNHRHHVCRCVLYTCESVIAAGVSVNTYLGLQCVWLEREPVRLE